MTKYHINLLSLGDCTKQYHNVLKHLEHCGDDDINGDANPELLFAIKELQEPVPLKFTFTM